MTQTIAFIGLGNMGGPMCANLVKAGYTVRVFDLSATALEAARAAGASPAASAAEAATGADIVITMLPAGQHVVGVWSDVLPHMQPGTLMIDCSTIDIDNARKAHALAAARGVGSLDAPVSGGVGGARGATLAFMTGGTPENFSRAEPILLKMGRKAFYCGAAGAGQAAKICNNMLLAISMIGVSEALILGEKLGLDHKVMFDVITASSGRCWSIEAYCPVPGPVPTSPANNGYKPGFATNLMLKDARLALQAATTAKAATPLADRAVELFSAFSNAGGSDMDFSAIITYLREQQRGSKEAL